MTTMGALGGAARAVDSMPGLRAAANALRSAADAAGSSTAAARGTNLGSGWRSGDRAWAAQQQLRAGLMAIVDGHASAVASLGGDSGTSTATEAARQLLESHGQATLPQVETAARHVAGTMDNEVAAMRALNRDFAATDIDGLAASLRSSAEQLEALPG